MLDKILNPMNGLIKNGIVGAVAGNLCNEGVAVADTAIQDAIDRSKDTIISRTKGIIYRNPYFFVPVIIMVGIILASIYLFFYGETTWLIKLPIYLLSFASMFILWFVGSSIMRLDDKINDTIDEQRDNLVNEIHIRCNEVAEASDQFVRSKFE